MMKRFWLFATCITMGIAAVAVHAQATTPSPAPTVQAASKGSTIKIDGRMFLGIFSSEDDGAYTNRALDVPDAKLRFTYTPSKDISVITRFSIKRATTTDGFDYFYLEMKNWGGVLPGHALRIGKVKMDVGEETWTDNPVEGILLTTSAAIVSGYDGGINFRGPLPIDIPATYSLGVYNGTGGLGSSTGAFPISAKLGIAPTENLYLSGSVFTSGNLLKSDGTVSSPALKVANLQSVPAGATTWSRDLWEVDVRWNYGKTGVKPVIPSSATQPFFQLGAAYGHFEDDFTGAADDAGNYWYVEGLVNVTPKVYLASRYSDVQLDDGATLKLVDSKVAVNSYNRLSLGVGYHLTPLTDLKVEYTINNAKGGVSTPELNQIAVGIATKF
ncbi:MAG: hypothetical protein ACYC7E_12770 [Armatimonadota bacterium]